MQYLHIAGLIPEFNQATTTKALIEGAVSLLGKARQL